MTFWFVLVVSVLLAMIPDDSMQDSDAEVWISMFQLNLTSILPTKGNHRPRHRWPYPTQHWSHQISIHLPSIVRLFLRIEPRPHLLVHFSHTATKHRLSEHFPIKWWHSLGQVSRIVQCLAREDNSGPNCGDDRFKWNLPHGWTGCQLIWSTSIQFGPRQDGDRFRWCQIGAVLLRPARQQHNAHLDQ